MFVLLDEPQSFADLTLAQSEIPRNRDLRLEPELRLSFGPDGMNVKTFLFARKEEEPKAARTEDRRTHEESVASTSWLTARPNGS